jgi:hypothetical protein
MAISKQGGARHGSSTASESTMRGPARRPVTGATAMNDLIAFLTSMVALSAGVERIVEAFKGVFRWLREEPDPLKDPDGSKAAYRRLALQMIATLAGALTVGFIGPSHFLPMLPADTLGLRVVLSALLGLMASGGSAFWNHALDILGAIKSVKEQDAVEEKRAVAPPLIAPPPTSGAGT